MLHLSHVGNDATTCTVDMINLRKLASPVVINWGVITSEGGFTTNWGLTTSSCVRRLCVHPCLSVCLSGSKIISTNYGRIRTKFGGQVGCVMRTN